MTIEDKLSTLDNINRMNLTSFDHFYLTFENDMITALNKNTLLSIL